MCRHTLSLFPKRWNRLLVFRQRDNPSVLLLVLLHEQERIVANIAEVLDRWP